MERQQKEKSHWRQHEERVEEKIKQIFPQDAFSVSAQHTTSVNTRVDVLVESKDGQAIVIDAKHYPNNPLPKSEIQDAMKYMKDTGAQKTVVIASKETNVSQAAIKFVESNEDVALVISNRNLGSNVLKVVADFDLGGDFSNLSISKIETPVDQRCSSMVTGRLFLREDGKPDARCADVRKGNILTCQNGDIDRRSSAVVQGEVKFKQSYI